MPGGAAGGLILFGQIIDATTTPVAGYLCDEYGAKRKLHILGKRIRNSMENEIYVFCLHPNRSDTYNAINSVSKIEIIIDPTPKNCL